MILSLVYFATIEAAATEALTLSAFIGERCCMGTDGRDNASIMSMSGAIESFATAISIDRLVALRIFNRSISSGPIMPMPISAA